MVTFPFIRFRRDIVKTGIQVSKYRLSLSIELNLNNLRPLGRNRSTRPFLTCNYAKHCEHVAVSDEEDEMDAREVTLFCSLIHQFLLYI